MEVVKRYAILRDGDGYWGIHTQRRGVSATVWDAVDGFLSNGIWDEEEGHRLEVPRKSRALSSFDTGRDAVEHLRDCYKPGHLVIRKDRRHGWRADVLV